MTTELETKPILSDTDEGEHDKFTHINQKDKTRGYMGGKVTALCGKRWIPKSNPSRYPLCQTCKEIATSKGWKVPLV